MDIFVKYLIEQKRLRILMDATNRLRIPLSFVVKFRAKPKCKSNNKEKCQKMTKQFVIHGS